MRLPGSSTLLPLAVLAMLAGFTFWLERVNRSDARGPNANLRHDPDYWVDQFMLRRYNPDGTIQHTLQALRMVHFPDDDTTEVTEPRVAYFRDGATTTMTAHSALLDKEGKHVRLLDEVRVVRRVPDGPETVAETSSLDVLPDEEQAETTSPVVLTQGRSVIHAAHGMAVNNKTRTTVLNGPVTGTIQLENNR